MKIFLTGSTGFIGSNLVEVATNQGHQIIAQRIAGSQPRIYLPPDISWVDGPLANDWSQHLSGCDALIHLAAHGVATGSHDWDRCYRINVLDSLQIWRQAVNAGIRRFVIIGSCFEYGKAGERYEYIPTDAPLEPTTAYAASKASATMAAQALAAENDLELAVLRLFHVYGPGENFRRFWPSLKLAAETGKDFPMTTGEQIRDFQHVKEACMQILRALEVKITKGSSKIFNLGSGCPCSLLDFAKREWESWAAKGVLKPGTLPHRSQEVFRYVPLVTPL